MTLTTTGLRAAGPLQCDPVRDVLGEAVTLVLLTAARSPKNLPFGGRAADRFGATVGSAPKTAP
jgi:hypothetical protein